MAVEDDIARIGWVLDNYDSVDLLTEKGKQIHSSEFLDMNHKSAPQIRFIKKIDGTYYVVESVFENGHKKLWVQSAYLQKNEDVTQTPAEGMSTNHETNAQSASASPSSNNSISENGQIVNAADGAVNRGRKVGWDGREVVTEAKGKTVTIDGVKYEFLGYDKNGSPVYQDAEVLKESLRSAEKKQGEDKADSQENVENAKNRDIINAVEMFKRDSNLRNDFKPLSQKRFDDLTIEARKNGATIIRGTQEVEAHLEHVGASASAIGDVLMFRSDATIGEVLEETYHFMQNRKGMNDDKREPLRTYLNEIDAKEYIIDNAKKYYVPRNEIDLVKRELEYYKKLLKEYNGGEE